MAVRNGASTYRCLGCKAELGAIRRTDAGVKVFAIAAGILARYRAGGTLELTCPYVRMSPVDGGGQEARPQMDAPR